MINIRNAEEEMERLAGLHDRIQRLRQQLVRLKQKQSDVYPNESRRETLFVTEFVSDVRRHTSKTSQNDR